MSIPPFRAGDWVWCNFPFRENPVQPGPEPHAAYTMAITGVPSGGYAAIVAYSTSQIPEKPWPEGLMHFAEKQAASMGHTKPFMLDPGRLAAVPINSAYFPYLGQADRGVIGHASPGLQEAIARAFREIVTKRRESFERRGPSWDRFR